MAKIKIDISNKKSDSIISTLFYDPINICPCCKYAISPTRISHLAFDKDNTTYVSLFEFCTNCYSTIINTYIAKDAQNSSSCIGTLYSSEPSKFIAKVFEQSLNDLSPQFTKIYNQALSAETSGLDEIAGLGYRKSLEFLIKDFAIHLQPSDEVKIQESWFKSVIDTYINDPTIKILVERSSWIGNDEAHYLRKQTNRDVNDMKKFIQAIVYYVGMYLITEDAESMDSMK